MSVTVTSKIESGVVVVQVSGRFAFLEDTLLDHVNERVKDQYRDFVLNVSDVAYVDSSGLGQLIGIRISIFGVDGELILLHPQDHLKKLLQMTKLDSVFQTSGDEVEAVRRISRIRARGATAV
jgi:anti-sigma B factor antagonist